MNEIKKKLSETELFLNPGTLYFSDLSTGETVKLGDTVEATVYADSAYADEEQYIQYVASPASATLTFNAHWDKRTLLSLMTDKHITNNWLKMHGGVMTRKGKGRKHK